MCKFVSRVAHNARDQNKCVYLYPITIFSFHQRQSNCCPFCMLLYSSIYTLNALTPNKMYNNT